MIRFPDQGLNGLELLLRFLDQVAQIGNTVGLQQNAGNSDMF